MSIFGSSSKQTNRYREHPSHVTLEREQDRSTTPAVSIFQKACLGSDDMKDSTAWSPQSERGETPPHQNRRKLAEGSCSGGSVVLSVRGNGTVDTAADLDCTGGE